MNKAIAFILMGSALSLSAQTVRFGVQAAVSLPANDLNNNATLGLQLGGHAKADLGEGHGIMARADLAFYSQNNGYNVNNVALAADYTYHFNGHQLGPYALAGISQQNYHTSLHGLDSNNSGLGIDLGLGYDVDRNVGMQVRYTNNAFNSLNYSALNLGVTYTF